MKNLIPASSSRWLKATVFVLILVFYGSLLAHKINLTLADDLPRQIKIGEEVLRGNFDIFYKNIFSYTEPEHRFYNHHWLSGVVFYLLHQAAGWNGLVIFKVAVFLTAFALIFLTAAKKANFWLVALLSLPAIFLLRERTGLRPEVFSYLFIAIYLYLLIDFEAHPDRKRIFWLIPLQLLWVNMHVFFSIGILMSAGFWLEKIIRHRKKLRGNPLIKKLTIVLAALVMVSFINPRGAGGVFYRYPGDDFPVPISENISLAGFFREYSLREDVSAALFIPTVILLAISFIFGFWRKPFNSVQGKPIFYFLAGTATAVLGFVIMRSMALFALMFLPAAAANFNGIFLKAREWLYAKPSRRGAMVGNILAAGLVVVLGLLIFPGWDAFFGYRERGIGLAPWSEEPAAFFKAQKLRGPIFNNADIGSYLVYALYPQEKVFADNRFADAYSASFFRDTLLTMQADEAAWREGLQEYNFNTIFFYHYDVTTNARDFLRRRMRDPAWSLVYADRLAVILVRNTAENQRVISQFQITRESAAERLRHLTESASVEDRLAAGDLFNLIGQGNLANAEFLDIVIHSPERGKVWKVLGETALSYNTETDNVLALMFLDKAISVGHRTAEAYSFLGAAYARLGQEEKAKEVLRKALKINPDREDAKQLLGTLEASTQE
jgi:tetratricopeptide (TPR) repeat protein